MGVRRLPLRHGALRFFNVFGTGQALSNSCAAVLAIFASRYLNGRPPVTFDDGRLWPEISGKYWAGDIRHCFADVSEARRILGYALQHFGGRTAGDRGLAGRSGGPRPYRRSGRGPGEKGSDSMNHLQGPILITGGAG